MDHNNREGENRGRIPSSRDQYRVDDHTKQRWVAVAQVAEMLSITRREIYYMIEAGELPVALSSAPWTRIITSTWFL